MKVTIKISTPTRNLKASVKVSRRMEVVTNSFVIHSARYVSQRLVSVLQSTLDVLNHIGKMTWKLPKSLIVSCRLVSWDAPLAVLILERMSS